MYGICSILLKNSGVVDPVSIFLGSPCHLTNEELISSHKTELISSHEKKSISGSYNINA